jgi:hypothetical protein
MELEVFSTRVPTMESLLTKGDSLLQRVHSSLVCSEASFESSIELKKTENSYLIYEICGL